MTDQRAGSRQPADAQREALHERIRNDYFNHAPRDQAVIDRFEACRDAALAFGDLVIDACPVSREQSLALTHLEEALMYARAAIARNQHEIPPLPDAD